VHGIATRAKLLVCLDEITSLAFRVFFESLNQQASFLLRQEGAPHSDLLPPTMMKQAVAQLKELMASFDASLLTPGASPGIPSSPYEQDFSPILSAVVDPLIQMCGKWSERLSDKADSLIFSLNCLQYITNALQLYGSFTGARSGLIEGQMEATMEALVEEEASQ
jgi:hypothetical protein